MDELTASIGVRLSKQAGDSNLSLKGMLDDSRALAARLGARVVAEHVDDGTSGSIRERPEFLGWMDDAISGRANLLIAPYTDRITREGVNVAAMVLDVVEGKAPGQLTPVRLVTVDGLDSDDEDSFRWKFVIQAEVARAELNRIRTRNRNTRRRLLEQGRWTGGAVPTGCRVVKRPNDAGKLVKYLEADPRWAPMIRRAAEQVVAHKETNGTEGKSVRAVAVEWNASELRPLKADQWQASTIRLTLLSDATVTHILGPALARAVILALDMGPKVKRGRPQKRILSSGNSVCHSCRRNMISGAGRYKCPSFVTGKTCEHPVTINAPHADEVVERRFLARFGELPYLELRVQVDGSDDLDQAIVAEEAAQAELLARPSAETAQVFAAAKARVAELRARPQTITRTYVDAGQTIAERWATLTTEAKRAELREALAEPVVILPNIGTNRSMDEGRIVTVWRDEVE